MGGKNNGGKSSQEMSFFDHLDELRPHLMRSAVAVLILTLAAFLLKWVVIDGILMGPQSPEFPTNRFLNNLGERLDIPALKVNAASFNLINTTVAGQLNLHLRISFITAIAVATPYILWEIWRFVKPALTPKELRGSRMFVLYVSLCFFIGLLFGYFIITPLALNFLINYTASTSIENLIDISSYLSTVLGTSIACAGIFQLPLLVYFLTKMGVIKPEFLARHRRHAIVVLAIVSAIITPPDALSMILVLLPFYALYELSIRLSRKVMRKKAEEIS